MSKTKAEPWQARRMTYLQETGRAKELVISRRNRSIGSDVNVEPKSNPTSLRLVVRNVDDKS
jgi:hypothetical protein